MAAVCCSGLEGLKYIRCIRAANFEDCNSSLVNGAEYAVINKDISTRDIYFEFDDCSTTRWNQCGLNVFSRFSTYSSLLIYRVKYLSDNMQGRGEVRSTIAHIQTDCLPNIGLQVTRGCHWIKLHILRLLCPCLLYRETL